MKNLDDTNAFPMVAVRSSGLGFESVIGYVNDGINEGKVTSLVDGRYLELLAHISNERFATNTERVVRFEYGIESVAYSGAKVQV